MKKMKTRAGDVAGAEKNSAPRFHNNPDLILTCIWVGSVFSQPWDSFLKLTQAEFEAVLEEAKRVDAQNQHAAGGGGGEMRKLY